jgi:tetratricopeptide (TPR) repeat protein
VRQQLRRCLPLVAACSLLAAAPSLADKVRDLSAEAEDIKQRAGVLSSQHLGKDGFRGADYPAERLIDGENFYRLKDYQRASIIFLDLIESYPQTAVYPDALFLFADSLFLSRDYYGARDWFKRVLDDVAKPGMARFRQKAIERLIEIAIHVDDFEGIDVYLQQLGQSPDAEARYVKGKYLFFRGDHAGALREFGTVSGNRALELKARYFVGVIHTNQGRYDEAIEVFSKGAAVAGETAEEREIVDLMNLGVGRLCFENDLLERAMEAYQKIEQHSMHFDAALYEVASVMIRSGDTFRAERVLEVLTLAIPGSRYIPRARLLRGNLLLRAGRYDEAERVFEETIDQFTPVKDQLDAVMAEQADTTKFFAGMIDRSLGVFDTSGLLPPLVIKWVGEERDVQRALNLTSDLGVAREYTRETERLIRLLDAVIDGPSRINAIPNLRTAMRRSQQFGNRLGQMRSELLAIEEAKVGDAGAEIGRLRDERRGLQDKLAALPTSDRDFERREQQARQIHQRMSHELARNIIRVDNLSAVIVAIERFIQDPRYVEGVPAENVEVLSDELERHRESVVQMRKQVTVLKEEVEAQRYQVGVGDARDRADEDLRRRIKDLVLRERALLRGRSGDLGAKLERVHGAIDAAESVVVEFQRQVLLEADRLIGEIRRQVNVERDQVAGYHRELLVLGDDAEQVVGGVTFANFSNVRKRFHELLLKADVGIIDVAWLRKEGHSERIRDLTKARLNEINWLDEEFREVRTQEKPER